jgi:hypothetical protein
MCAGLRACADDQTAKINVITAADPGDFDPRGTLSTVH